MKSSLCPPPGRGFFYVTDFLKMLSSYKIIDIDVMLKNLNISFEKLK